MSARPLHIIGKAKLVHINARKEGPEDDKILATDLKFTLSTSSEFLIYFHSQLRLMLFTKEGEPRFPLMGPVDWDYEFLNMRLTVDPMTLDPELSFAGVKLKKWVFQPKQNSMVAVSFSAQVKPDRQQFGIIGRALIAEEVTLRVFSENGDLFESEPTAGQVAARAAAATRREEEPELPLGEPPQDQHADLKECPTCGSPNRAVNTTAPDEGEGQVCTDAWHTVEPAPVDEAPPAEEPPPPPPLELNDGMLQFMRAAGAAEAKKHDDERDFDTGFVTACKNADLPKDFVEEHRGALESAFTDGYEEELNKAES